MVYPIRIQHVQAEGRRLLATSDLHGEPEMFRAVLEKAGFSKDDVLVLVGDYVRHGRKSLELLRDVMALCETHTVFPLLGNNDIYTLSALEEEGEKGVRRFLRELGTPDTAVAEMAREQGVSEPPRAEAAEALREQLRRAYAKELDFLRGLPAILDTGDYLFVHGGLTTADYESLEGGDAYSCSKVDDYLRRFSVVMPKYCVVGHWPIYNYRKIMDLTPIVEREKRVISIDGGCGLVPFHGQANLLLLPREVEKPAAPLVPPEPLEEGFAFWHADNLPVYRVKIPQAEGHDGPSCNIRWGDQRMEVLERDGDMVHLRHCSTGGRIWAPVDWTWEQEGEGLLCLAATNYELPVETGDRLSVIRVTAKGIYGKKGSLCGWYRPGLAGLEPKEEKESV